MKINLNSEKDYKTIGEVAKELGLINKENGLLQTHTLRYWATQFKQIKPKIRAGKRRYYSKKDFEVIKLIKFLLRDRGLTINGVKKILNSSETRSIDDHVNFSVYKPNLKNTKNINEQVKKIYKIIQKLKEFKKGDSVQITEGVFKNCIAIFESFKSEERVILLMNLMGQQQKISTTKKSLLAL